MNFSEQSVETKIINLETRRLKTKHKFNKLSVTKCKNTILPSQATAK